MQPEHQKTRNEDMIILHVRGLPKPQPRPRFVKGRVISTVDRGTKAWKSAVAREARSAAGQVGGLKGPVMVDSIVFMPTKDSSRWGKPHDMRPDRDNLDKAILDALSDAGMWRDDCQAWAGGVRKTWCKPGMEGAVILINPSQGAKINPPWQPQDGPGWL